MTQSHRNEFVAYVHYLADTELEKVAYRLVKDRADAKDVVRETVAEALRREAEFDASTGTEGLKKWVLAICASQGESYRPSSLRDQIPALRTAARTSSYESPEEREDPLLRASRTVQLAAERKGLSRTGLGDGSDDNELARRLSKSGTPAKPGGSKHATVAPKSTAFVARTRQRQADNEDRSRQFFDDLLNNILANREDETE
jgi:hypothetical protein